VSYADEVWGRRTEEAISTLGPAIVSLGIATWKPGMIFVGTDDRILKRRTGKFPARRRPGLSGHPLFVIETLEGNIHRVCPCTSKYKPRTRYIRAGCVLKDTGRIMSRTSFILDEFAFNISPREKWVERLRYLGRAPKECIGKSV